MAYQFPLDIRDRITAHMAGGRYQSEYDVIRDALNALDELEQSKLARWNEWNRIAIEQSRLGLSKPLDQDALLLRLRERLAKKGIFD